MSTKRTRFFAVALLAAACAALLASGGKAATVDGTIVTNVVSGTFSTTFVPEPGSGYSVSYAATARVLVQDPCLEIEKYADPTAQSPDLPVTFTIWVINCSYTASAFSIWVEDKLPINTGYEAGGYSSDVYDVGVTWFNYYSLDDKLVWQGPAEMPDGTVGTGLEWLGFWLERLGPRRSAWVSYRVTVQ